MQSIVYNDELKVQWQNVHKNWLSSVYNENNKNEAFFFDDQLRLKLKKN